MNVREVAYDIVKKMKAAYTTEGCDWQIEIERALRVAAQILCTKCKRNVDCVVGGLCINCGNWPK